MDVSLYHSLCPKISRVERLARSMGREARCFHTPGAFKTYLIAGNPKSDLRGVSLLALHKGICAAPRREPVDIVPHLPHPLHFLLGQRAESQRLEVGLHLYGRRRSGQTNIHIGIRKHETVAVHRCWRP